jgi:hypothetical protein
MPRADGTKKCTPELVLLALQATPDGLTHPEACARSGSRWQTGSTGLWHLVDTGRAQAIPTSHGAPCAYRFQAVG